MKKGLIVLLAVLMLAVLLSGCFQKALKGVLPDGSTYSKKGDGYVIKTDEGDVEISGGGNASWPKDKMGGLPELKGNVVSSISSSEGCVVGVEGVTLSEVKAYIEKVKAAGFEGSEMSFDENSILFVGAKGDSQISITFSADTSDGKGTCIVSLGKSQS